MNNETNGTSAAFMEVASRQMQQQDHRIAALEERINTLPDHTPLMEELIKEIRACRQTQERLQQVPVRLDLVMARVEDLQRHSIRHPKLLVKVVGVAAGLLLVLCLAGSGWYVTGSRLKSYKANDTKYRYLRLDTANQRLQLYLDQADEHYRHDPDLRKKVIEAEELNQRNFERLQKAERLKREARELEKATGRK